MASKCDSMPSCTKACSHEPSHAKSARAPNPKYATMDVNMADKKATRGCIVQLDATTPMPVRAPEKTIRPKYEPHTAPKSKFHAGRPNMPTTSTKDSVGSNAAMDTAQAPRNLAKTTCPSVRGRVKSSSSVPARCSSANERIVMAGMRNMSTHGAMAKNGSKVAMPPSRMFHPPGKSHKNRLVKSKNTATDRRRHALLGAPRAALQ